MTALVQSLASLRTGTPTVLESAGNADPNLKEIAESAAKILLSIATKSTSKE